MSISRKIKKVLFIGIWCTIGTGVLLLLIAAMRAKEDKTCTGIHIELLPKGEANFLNKATITSLLTATTGKGVKGRSVKSFDLREMENRLEKNSWIRDAELFFDNNQVLQVKVEERKPVARVFASNGQSFYLDSGANRLPLSGSWTGELPVFTGFTDKQGQPAAARKTLKEIVALSQVIRASELWMAQIAQVELKGNENFELIPSIGNQVIEFGSAADAEKKFRRLLLFYQQVLSKTGLERYQRIKLQYAGQVVGVRSDRPLSRNDSLQAIRKVQQLIALAQTEQERMMQLDSLQVGRDIHRSDNEGTARMSDTLSMTQDYEADTSNRKQRTGNR